jgi:DNA topoisomerase-3
MSKTLIIAEKPSVANDLQRVIGNIPGVGKFSKKQDYFENDRFIVTSAVGHLVQQQMPTTAAGKALPWNFDVLPVIPESFVLEPIPGNKGRFDLLRRLMKRKEVAEIVNACDAGREGELIFRYIIQLAGIDKPTRRMWMQSMTNNAIREAFESLRSDADMQPLADAALCRSESDWLIGINSSRAMTAFNSKFGGFNKTPVGRVQTPTLALLAEREVEIRDFVASTYWEVHGSFAVEAGNYPGKWFDENFRKKDTDDKHARADRLWEKAAAEAIVARCHGQRGSIEQTTKPSKQAPPLLYDLTSLQREAAGRFGFSARRTLQLAQRLYEAHKALTYPRTDSRYLPEDYVPTTTGTMRSLAAANGGALTNLPPYAGKVIENSWVRPNKRIFDSAKVSDHFAIIPTGQIPKGLDEAERKLYDMVTRRFIAVFYPAAEFEVTKRITRIGEDAFRSDGKILRVPGWLEVYGKSVSQPGAGDDADENGGKNPGDRIIVPASDGDTATAESIEAKENETKPPPRYNEGTLLGAMETAGKFVEDEELREAMSERGLGTPATRAATIEGLIEDKYIAREQREFFVTARGLRLIEQLNRMQINILSSPEMTGEWEHKLKLMEQGRMARPQFMAEIRDLTGHIVTTAKTYADSAIEREWPRFQATCPTCQASSLAQDDGRWKCDNEGCKFALPKVIASRPINEQEAGEILEKGRLGPLTGFVSRFRQPFDATIVLEEDKKAGFKAGFEFEKSEAEEAEQEAVKDSANRLCPCPLCEKGNIFVTPTSFLCERRAEGGNKACKARLAREMCKIEIPREQALKYFTEGKTDIIETWISKKGRPFSAAITCNTKANTKGRMLGWEFPPREPKKKAAKKAAAK